MIRTYAWYVLGILYFSITSPLLLRVKYLDRVKKHKERDDLASRFTMFIMRLIVRTTGSTVNVTGLENLPKGSVLFVSNHQSHFDSAVIEGYINKPKGFVSIV